MSITSKDGLLALCGSLMGLSTIAVGLRFYGRKQQNLRLLTDDWTALVAVLTYIATSVIVFLSVHSKFLGYSSIASEGEGAAASQAVGQGEAAFDVINTTTLGWVKLSAIFLIRRIFRTGNGHRWMDVATIVTAVIVVMCYTAWSFVALFQCGTHFAAFWNGEFVQQCTLNVPWALGFAISDLILDIWVLILPIPSIWGLQVSLAKRLSITGVFLLAFVGLGASIARIVIFSELVAGGAAYQFTHDLEREQTKLAYVQMLESGISVTAVNLPSLWMLCTRIIPSRISNGLRSLHSMLSLNKSRGSDVSVSTTVTAFSTCAASGVFEGDTKIESYITQDTAPTSFLRADWEEKGVGGHPGRRSDGGQERSRNSLSGIYVQKDIEVTRV